MRGPASVLYGEGSIGGIINVIPKKPTPFFTHEGFAAVGTDQSRRIAVGSGGPINDVLQYRVDVAGNSAKSWLSDNNDYRNYDFATQPEIPAERGLPDDDHQRLCASTIRSDISARR